MDSTQIIIVRTGTANIGSITAAVSRLFKGLPIHIVSTPDHILDASHVIVPGVGTFKAALDILSSCGCKEAVQKRIKQGKPTMFICVGLQILAKSSEESEGETGFNLLKDAQVTKFSKKVCVPQQGWNRVFPAKNSRFIPKSGFCYFSNSYKIDPSQVPEDWSASVSYYGEPFVAAVEKGNIFACQFHPELSGEYGLSLVKNWFSVTCDKTITLESTLETFTSNTINNKTHRIIPCLDVKDGKVVKGIKFQNITDAGDPTSRALEYEKQGADELVMLDISATVEGRKTKFEVVKSIRSVISIPLTVGGGVSSLEDAKALLDSGADKVAINTAAVKNPQLIQEISNHFGKQCTVLSLDAAKRLDGKGWEVVIQAGKDRTGIDAVEWAVKCVGLGAGEILLTSWDKDGTKSGYDLELIKAISEAVSVPVIASGGAATSEHLIEGLKNGADAVLAASIFHYNDYTVQQLKEELAKNQITVRL
jgi:cyclase